MGQGQSSERREIAEMAKATHFTESELRAMKAEFERISGSRGNCSITKDEFMMVIKDFVNNWTAGSVFMERLFGAFDENGDLSIDFREFIKGLSVFMKGTAEEKLLLSFKIYDTERNGFVTRNQLEHIMSQMYSLLYNEDQSEHIKLIVDRVFEDLDENGDEQLTLAEYKLSALKEPMIVDFLHQFLASPEEAVN